MAVEEYAGASGEPASERRTSLVSLLVEAGLASEEQLQLALAEGLATGERLGEVVVRHGLIDQAGLGRILARQRGLPFLDDAEVQPKRQRPPELTPARAIELQACPIVGRDAGVLMAVAEPSDERLSAVCEQLGGDTAFVVVAQDTLEQLFQQLETGEEGEQAEAAATLAGAAAATEERERPLEQLLGDFEVACARLTELRSRAEQLLRQQEQTQAELDASHHELEQLRQERDQDRAEIARLERQLGEERRRLHAVKARIGELSETLAGA